MQAIGGLMAARELWERALIPSLLSGAGTWIGDCKEAVTIYKTDSCPKVALKCETKMLGMKWRVWQEKILLLMQIRSHDTDTLCRLIYEEGKSRGWPRLGQEVTDICQNLNIPDVNHNLVPKSVVKEAIFEHHYSEMKEEVSKMKKLYPIKDQDFREVQNHFMDKSIENGRTSFKFRSKMLEEIHGNFKNKFKN